MTQAESDDRFRKHRQVSEELNKPDPLLPGGVSVGRFLVPYGGDPPSTIPFIDKLGMAGRCRWLVSDPRTHLELLSRLARLVCEKMPEDAVYFFRYGDDLEYMAVHAGSRRSYTLLKRFAEVPHPEAVGVFMEEGRMDPGLEAWLAQNPPESVND